MAGFFCISSARGEPSPQFIEAAARTQKYYPWLQERRWGRPGLDLVVVLPAPWHERVVTHEEGGLFLLVDGEIFEDEPRGQIEAAAGSLEERLGPWLMARYKRKGISALCGLNGTYNVIVWNAEERRLEIANDILGVRPCFLWASGDECFAGSEYRPLLTHPRFTASVDLAGLSDFLILGYPIANRSLMAGVGRLDAGGAARWQGSSWQTERHAILQFTRERWTEPFNRLLEAHQSVLSRAFERRVEPGVSTCVPLSGGLDSRTALSFAVRLGARAEAAHLGAYRTSETRVARQVARSLGIPLTSVRIEPDFLWRYRQDYVATLEGCCDLRVGFFFPLIHAIRARHPLLIPGYMGDATLSPHFKYIDKFEEAKDYDDLFRRAFRGFSDTEGGFEEGELARILRAPVARAMVGVTRTASRQLFDGNGANLFERAMHWEWLERQRYFVGSYLRILSNSGQVRLPFADREYLEFAVSLPLLALDQKYLYRTRLRRFDTRLARIIYTDEARPLEPSIRVGLAITARRIGRNLARRCGFARRPDDMWISVNDCRPPACADVLVETREILANYFDPTYIDELIREIPGNRWAPYSGSASSLPRWDKARKVVALGLWAKAFLSNAAGAPRLPEMQQIAEVSPHN